MQLSRVVILAVLCALASVHVARAEGNVVAGHNMADADAAEWQTLSSNPVASAAGDEETASIEAEGSSESTKLHDFIKKLNDEEKADEDRLRNSEQLHKNALSTAETEEEKNLHEFELHEHATVDGLDDTLTTAFHADEQRLKDAEKQHEGSIEQIEHDDAAHLLDVEQGLEQNFGDAIQGAVERGHQFVSGAQAKLNDREQREQKKLAKFAQKQMEKLAMHEHKVDEKTMHKTIGDDIHHKMHDVDAAEKADASALVDIEKNDEKLLLAAEKHDEKSLDATELAQAKLLHQAERSNAKDLKKVLQNEALKLAAHEKKEAAALKSLESKVSNKMRSAVRVAKKKLNYYKHLDLVEEKDLSSQLTDAERGAENQMDAYAAKELKRLQGSADKKADEKEITQVGENALEAEKKLVDSARAKYAAMRQRAARRH